MSEIDSTDSRRVTSDPGFPLIDGFSDEPYWYEGLAAMPTLPERPPARADVAIVGSGYTGLNAAIETSRAGRSTIVLESGTPGQGCSTRNGGQIGISIKPSLARLVRKHGPKRAKAIRTEGRAALEWIEERIGSERIQCDFCRSGRFHAAHTPWHYERLVRHAETAKADEGIEFQAVPKSDQHRELGTDRYFGGVVYPGHASLDPAKYHRGLLHRVLDEGAIVTGDCRVQQIVREPDGFLLNTAKGAVKARDVVVATNGYTSRLTPWVRRRLIPIGSYIIATELLPDGLVDRLFPTGRVVSNSCKVIYYFRTSPDRRRILFGGRVSASETDPSVCGPRLHAAMCRIFPELADRHVTHSWMGTVAYTFDDLPHVGIHDGVHHAVGYCGTGVSMASYLGMRLGQKVLGSLDGRTAFDSLPFPARPFYNGAPWFLPAAVSWYRWLDRRQIRRAELCR